jgi:cytochrome c peroxidase
LAGLYGSFREPSLRNGALTAPYMQHGYFNSLREGVEFATRDKEPERFYPSSADGTAHRFDDLPEAYHGNVNTVQAPYDRTRDQQPRMPWASAPRLSQGWQPPAPGEQKVDAESR